MWKIKCKKYIKTRQMFTGIPKTVPRRPSLDFAVVWIETWVLYILDKCFIVELYS